jgi:hypothetical protein
MNNSATPPVKPAPIARRARFGLLLVLPPLLGAIAFAVQNAPSTPVLTAPSTPTITVVSGDKQKGAPGNFNPKPFDIAVWNADGTEPLVDVPVTFTVESGGGLLANSKDSALLPSYTLTLKTDQDGTVQAYYKQPFGYGVPSQIKASSTSGELTLETITLGVGETLDDDSSTTSGDSSTAKSASAKHSGSGVFVAFATNGTSVSTKSSTTNAKAHALTVSALQVVLRTPASNYKVDTSTWAISPL